MGELRQNRKAIQIAAKANADNIDCLVISFVNDPLPRLYSNTALLDKAKESLYYSRLNHLIRILDILEKRKIITKVLTKNANILEIAHIRDSYDFITLGCSITTNVYNESVTKYFEPNTSSIRDRLLALNLLNKHGFKTWVSIEPILPNTNVLGLIHSLVSRNVSEIWIGKNNYDPELMFAFNWKQLCKTLLKYQPLYYPKLKIKLELLKAGGIIHAKSQF